jgi:potassium channel subfamily K
MTLTNKFYRVTAMNAVSLFWGVVGNIFLLLNFTQTVRYIIALPVTIVSWFLATGIVSERNLPNLTHG